MPQHKTLTPKREERKEHRPRRFCEEVPKYHIKTDGQNHMYCTRAILVVWWRNGVNLVCIAKMSPITWSYVVWISTTILVIYNQGCVIRRIRIIRCIVFNAYFTVLNKSGRITIAKFADFCRNRPF